MRSSWIENNSYDNWIGLNNPWKIRPSSSPQYLLTWPYRETETLQMQLRILLWGHPVLRVDPNPKDWCLYKRKEKEIWDPEKGRWPWEDGNRDGTYVATNQGNSEPEGFSPWGLWRQYSFADTSSLHLWPLELWREWIPTVSGWVCGHLLQQPWKTNTYVITWLFRWGNESELTCLGYVFMQSAKLH